jgi:hypothetical protein
MSQENEGVTGESVGAPERVWLSAAAALVNDARLQERRSEAANFGDVEYVRADLVAPLVEALRGVVTLANEAYDAWDCDADMSVGKILKALAEPSFGHYTPRAAAVHAALASTTPQRGDET